MAAVAPMEFDGLDVALVCGVWTWCLIRLDSIFELMPFVRCQ